MFALVASVVVSMCSYLSSPFAIYSVNYRRGVCCELFLRLRSVLITLLIAYLRAKNGKLSLVAAIHD